MSDSQGTVKWFDPVKGYGFIAGGPQGDVFVHARNLDEGFTELIEGQEVSFSVRPGVKGPEAYAVRVTRESMLPPRPRPSLQHARPRYAQPSAGLPGAVTATVVSQDTQNRFMFARSERDGVDIYVHGSLFQRLGAPLGPGTRIRVTVEEGPRGLRARTLELM